jgi:hypothetical protein
VTGADSGGAALDPEGSTVGVGDDASGGGEVVSLTVSVVGAATSGVVADVTAESANGERPLDVEQAVRTMAAETQAATRYTSM